MLCEPVCNNQYLSSILNDFPLNFDKLSSFIFWRFASRQGKSNVGPFLKAPNARQNGVISFMMIEVMAHLHHKN
jgi:hypothetical protein